MSSARTVVHVFYDRRGLPPVTIPAGTVFGDGVSSLRWVNMFPETLRSGEMKSIAIHADYAGEEYNVRAETIDRILEPSDLNDMWNSAALLVTQPMAAVGGVGHSRRLADRQRQMDALALDARIADRARQALARSQDNRYVMGMDMARGTDYTVTGAPDVISWTHDLAAMTSNVEVRHCVIDEACGMDRPPRPARQEPTTREVWAD